MKTIILALALSFSAWAQNPGCHSQQGAQQKNTSVTTSTATTIAVGAGTNSIHVCQIVFSLPESNSVSFQASDGTVLSGPNLLVGTYSISWDGQLSTVAGGAAPGSSFQIKLGTNPSVAVGVTVIYYTSQ